MTKLITKMLLALLLGAAALSSLAQGRKLTPVTMTLNWYPQAEHGGYFTALVEGIYEKHGLDVTLKPGGPQVNIHQLLAAGQTDFIMGAQMRTLNARHQGVPIVTVAAWFQKDPQTVMVHEGSGNDSIAALKGKPFYLPGTARSNYWPWMRLRFGLTDDQIKPYDPAYRAWGMDKQAASQGYLSADDYYFRKLGIAGKSMLLSDFGWLAYGSLLDTTEKVIADKPEVVQAFVRATRDGWQRFFANPGPAYARIAQMNPEQEMVLMTGAYRVMRERGILDSEDTKGGKYGAMNDARWEGFFKDVVAAGVLPATLEFRKAYTLQFVKD